jgi:prepilin-type N-terminal cleavage/methylation domain-containing protein
MGLRRAHWENQGGFTLIEVMITIIIMGIVFAIASSTWFGAIESRKVDSGTNRLAADLRQAHSKATNRLADQTVTLTLGNSEYTMTGGGTGDLDDYPTQDVVSVAAASTIVFHADGSAQVTGANPIEIRATNNTAKNYTIEINPATSEIKVVP